MVNGSRMNESGLYEEPIPAESIGGYTVPEDPAEWEGCESCQ